MPRPRRRSATPLYDPRFEHDACGVGFVADAGGRSRARVLPLALAGLAALAHRGAFGADGESSDGAGVSLPLDAVAPDGAHALDGGGPAGGRDAVPAARPCRGRAARALVGAGLRRGRPADRRLAARADGPGRARARPRRRPARPWSRPSSPDRPGAPPIPGRSPTTPSSAAWSSPAGGWNRRRGPPGARWRSCRCRPRRAGRSSTRASSPAGAWPSSTRTCCARRARLRGLPPALRHEHPSRLAARPAVPLDRPQRRDQHGPRQSRAGPRSRSRPRRSADRRRADSPPARCSRRTAPIRCRSTRGWSC